MKKPPEYGPKHKLNIHESQVFSMTERYGADWVERNCTVVKAAVHVYCTTCGKVIGVGKEHVCDHAINPEHK